LAWTAATDNVGVTNYLLYRNGALVKTLGKVLTYKDAGLTKNTAYTYTLYATDAAGNRSPASNTITVRTKLV
jgi:chitodextrinase